jgi:hypothetical protein
LLISVLILCNFIRNACCKRAICSIGGVFWLAKLTLSTRQAHTCAINSNKELFCWGSNSDGQVTVAHYPTSRVRLAPVCVIFIMHVCLSTILHFCLCRHECYISMCRFLFLFWFFIFLQLGIGSQVSQSSIPTFVPQLDQGVLVVSLGADYSCAIDLTKALYCWGNNLEQQVVIHCFVAVFPLFFVLSLQIAYPLQWLPCLTSECLQLGLSSTEQNVYLPRKILTYTGVTNLPLVSVLSTGKVT